MRRWVTAILEGESPDSVPKARRDIVELGKSVGYDPVYIFRYIDELESDQALLSRIDGITAPVSYGDILIYQYPSYNGYRFDSTFLDRMQMRGVHVVFLIHDSEMLRGHIPYDEVELLNRTSAIIIHGEEMKQAFIEKGVNKPMIEKNLFDYLPEENTPNLSPNLEKKLVFAGNIQKSPFLYDWNYDTEIMAFGLKSENPLGSNVNYRGSYMQKDLIRKIPTDRFGISWDDNLEGGGQYKTYTKYNSPHKVSLYLSLGMPVFVWNESAASRIINKYRLGFSVSSLDEIDEILNNMTTEELIELKQRVNKFSTILRSGGFTRYSIVETERILLT